MDNSKIFFDSIKKSNWHPWMFKDILDDQLKYWLKITDASSLEIYINSWLYNDKIDFLSFKNEFIAKENELKSIGDPSIRPQFELKQNDWRITWAYLWEVKVFITETKQNHIHTDSKKQKFKWKISQIIWWFFNF